jgi:hypothetical protein
MFDIAIAVGLWVLVGAGVLYARRYFKPTRPEDVDLRSEEWRREWSDRARQRREEINTPWRRVD